MQAATKLPFSTFLPDIFHKTRKAYSLHQSVKNAQKLFIASIATSEELRNEAFKIRYDVFAKELGLEPLNDTELERTPSDDYSLLCLMSVSETLESCGTIRVVSPYHEHQLLPIEEYCLDAITEQAYHPSNFERDEICEISRLAVPSTFRRRNFDNINGAGIGNIRHLDFYKKNSRAFPLIAVCLYISAAAIAITSGRKHAYVMIEPSLARRMSSVGLCFKQIGDVVDYHGKRAPFYIHADDPVKNMKFPFKSLFNHYLEHFDSVEDV